MSDQPAAVDAAGLLFLHIPKTAGTSLKRFLYHQLPVQDCLLDPPAAYPYEPGMLDRFRLVAGHLDYDFVGHYLRRPFVLTCLRHPVERALSAYYYQRTPRLAIEIAMAAPKLGKAFTEQVLDDLRRLNRHDTLRDFLRADPDLARKTLGNTQTDYLAGAAATAAYASEPERLLAIASRHLAECDGILLADRLTETLALIDPQWGERARVGLAKDNATPERRAVQEHGPEDLEALAELTSLDLALYRHAEQLIEQRRIAARSAPQFPAELPDAVDFSFDQPIRGRGWHVREPGSGRWFCWTDREALMTLQFRSPGDHRLDCMVEHAACAEAWADLAVSVNGFRVALTEKPSAPPGRIAAHIPGDWLGPSPGPVTIGFRVTQTVCPSERDPGNSDARRLGVALSHIRLVALGRPGRG